LTLPTFPRLSDKEMREKLLPPTRPVRCVLDTDCKNEIDDQFALAWALLSEKEIFIEACYAEPYSHECYRQDLIDAVNSIKSNNSLKHVQDGAIPEKGEEDSIAKTLRYQKIEKWAQRLHRDGIDPQKIEMLSPKEGMQKSYEEILNVYELLDMNGKPHAYLGAENYLKSIDFPVASESTEDLIARAKEYRDEPLYVSAIGCVTNIASAILMAPEIVRNIVVLWTAAYPTSVRIPNSSFNLDQDILAAQVLFDSGVPHLYLPGYHVGAQLTLSLPDMKAWIQDKGRLGQYLFDEYIKWYQKRQNESHIFDKDSTGTNDMRGYTKVIWDLINIAWLLRPRWVPTEIIRAPSLENSTYWRHHRGDRHLMREAYDIDRDGIFQDLIAKFEKAPN